ncbi:MAG TPA: hypothetical protein VHX86_10305 [Tepidisphaeraceae bacterium]|jgi:hypothetical protein|nr:hypothetical protein [Tepidisphaeraceae bacterium]
MADLSLSEAASHRPAVRLPNCGEIHPSEFSHLPLQRWLIFFVILGVGLRLFRYALGLPLWGDEGFLGVNILDRGYRGLLQPMEYIQVAPIGFLWTERAMYQALGMSEYIMRLIPTLEGVAAVVLFAFWARKTLEPLAATIATGVLAVSDLSIRHAVELKPYGGDLFFSLALLVPATLFLLEKRDRWLWFLIFIAPIGLFMSLPNIFVAGGIAATLFVMARKLSVRQRVLAAVFAVVAAGSFLVLMRISIRMEFAGAGPDQLKDWVFPPYNPVQFVVWFWHSHLDNFFGYPIDLSYPWAGVSFALMVVGAVVMFGRRRGWIACLLLAPFGMTFIAAMLRKYPYADSPRVGQHLVGPICLLIGLGIASIVERFARTNKTMRITQLGVFAVLILIGVIGSLGTVLKPTSEARGDWANRQFIRDALDRAPPDATVAALEHGYKEEVLTRWYLHEWPHRMVWDARISDLPGLTQGPLWIFSWNVDSRVNDQIARAMGTPPTREYECFGAGMGTCEILIFPGRNDRRRLRSLGSADVSQFLADVVDGVHQLVVADVVTGRFLGDEGDGAGRLQDGAVHFGEGAEPLAMRGRGQFGTVHQLAVEVCRENPAMADEIIAIAFHELFQPPVAMDESDDEIVHKQECGRPEESAGDGVVVADDGVLHRIRQGQQDDQVERIELRQLAFPGQPEADEQEQVHANGAKDFFQDGKLQNEHIVPGDGHAFLAV